MQRPRSDFPLHFDAQDIYQICMDKRNASTRRLLPDVYITTDESFLVHNKQFNEMPYKLNVTEHPRSFEK